MDESKEISNYNNQTFESIKHIDENGVEFWYARELQVVLDYTEWRKFENVIGKAKKHVKMLVSMCLNILSMPTKR